MVSSGGKWWGYGGLVVVYGGDVCHLFFFVKMNIKKECYIITK